MLLHSLYLCAWGFLFVCLMEATLPQFSCLILEDPKLANVFNMCYMISLCKRPQYPPGNPDIVRRSPSFWVLNFMAGGVLAQIRHLELCAYYLHQIIHIPGWSCSPVFQVTELVNSKSLLEVTALVLGCSVSHWQKMPRAAQPASHTSTSTDYTVKFEHLHYPFSTRLQKAWARNLLLISSSLEQLGVCNFGRLHISTHHQEHETISYKSLRIYENSYCLELARHHSQPKCWWEKTVMLKVGWRSLMGSGERKTLFALPTVWF